MKQKYLMTGNEACGEGAVQAGCRFYAGYPITPQNELTAYMSRRMEETGGVFIQSESELAAINMVLGASLAGAWAMTSSSSPGISLKQEGISYLAGCEIPAVIVNVMRGGPGLGNISGAQGDYFQATKGGGHGDYRIIVYAPSTVQEMFDLTYNSFAAADKYRIPVMVLADGMLGQMMEPLEFDKNGKPPAMAEKSWILTGAEGREARHVKSLFLGSGEKSLERHNEKLQAKYRKIEKEEMSVELYKTDDADKIIVAYGLCSRIGRSCVDALRAKGEKVGLIRPITLWPFPYDAIRKIAQKNRVKGQGSRVKGSEVRFLVVEMSAGQMVEDVRLAVQDDERVAFYGRMGGGVPEEEVIAKKLREL